VKIKPRSINYFSTNAGLTVDVIPAQYKNIDGSQYVVAKRGYVVMRLVGYNSETEEVDYAKKREFIVSPQNVDSIIGIEAHRARETMDEEGEVLFYTDQMEPEVTKVLRITPTDSGDFNIMFAGLINEEELVDKMDITIKKGQFIVIQKMLEYALPSFYGWHAIYDPKAVEH
jgi:hypothetical protein